MSDFWIDEPMSLSDAVIGLKAYKEVDERATQLWRDVESSILFPRMDTTRETLQCIYIDDVSGIASSSLSYKQYVDN